MNSPLHSRTGNSRPGSARIPLQAEDERQRAETRPRYLAIARRFALAMLLVSTLSLAFGQDPPANPGAPTNAPAPEAKPAASSDTNAPAGAAASTNQDIQVSFQGANIDMIVQWLAQQTGKSVVKHPQAQCQLTIMSSKKLPLRDAISLIYRAISLEGISVIESSTTIMLVPEGKEPKLNPEVLDASRKDIPEGHERLVKMFPLAHVQGADLKEKLRGLLSDKGSIEVDDSVNQLIVTDYNDNLRLIAQLINEFDVPESGTVLKIYPLKYGDAEEIGNLIGLIMNLQTSGSSSSSSSSPASRPSGSSARNFPISIGGPPGMPMPSGESGGGGPSPAVGASGQGIRIWPDRISNRLVVSAPKARLAELERLLLILDTEKTADVTVRVMPLKNIQAVDLVKDIGPLYQKAGGGKTGKETIEVA
ncbi:MAG: secretin N-terminal domain-containing protein, partial [Limisphaerales bacterium]